MAFAEKMNGVEIIMLKRNQKDTEIQIFCFLSYLINGIQEVVGGYVREESNGKRGIWKEIHFHTFSCMCNTDFNIYTICTHMCMCTHTNIHTQFI